MQLEIFINKLATKLLGTSMVDSIVAQKGKFRLKDYSKCRARIKMLNAEIDNCKSHSKSLLRTCEEFISPVTSPLVLISQIQRSGGTLLSQLLDGHPEVHAHPYELKMGFPRKMLWPKIDLNDRPEHWFEILFEDNVINHFKKGYKKGQQTEQLFPFLFFPSVQKKLFLTYLSSIESVTLRDVFDAYMTSYFGAWLNNQNNYCPKKFITAFTPRLAMVPDSIESFFDVYPDGKLLSVIRDPKNWYPSAFRHNTNKKRYGDINHALNQWKESARSMLRNKKRWKDKVSIIQFEDLVKKPESVMRYLSGFLGIEFDEILLTPTFNKKLIAADTSFKLEKPGIMSSTLDRYKTLSKEELKIIVDITDNVYQQLLNEKAIFRNTPTDRN